MQGTKCLPQAIVMGVETDEKCVTNRQNLQSTDFCVDTMNKDDFAATPDVISKLTRNPESSKHGYSICIHHSVAAALPMSSRPNKIAQTFLLIPFR
jgi:hypothetical protein